MDDLKSQNILKVLRQRIDKFTVRLFQELEATSHRLQASIQEFQQSQAASSQDSSSREVFEQWVQTQPEIERELLRAIQFNKADPIDALTSLILRNISSLAKFEETRGGLVNNLQFFGAL